VTIASLIVDVSANTVKLQKDVDAIHGDLNKVGRVATALGKTLAATFTIAAVGAAIRQVVDFGSRMTDLSAKTGIGTTGLQKLDLAFKQSGVSLETVTGSVTRLARNLIEGDKSTVGALRRLGLSLDSLKKMAPEQQFITVADAIGKIQNPTERAWAAMQVFGRGGAELLPGLTGHLAKTTEAFERMGLIIDEKTVKAADDFGDQMTVLTTLGRALIAQVLAPMLPALAELAKWFATLAGGAMDLGRAITDGVILKFMQANLKIKEWTLAIMESTSKLPFHFSIIKAGSDALNKQREAVQQTKDAIRLFSTTTSNATTVVKAAAPPLLGLGKAMKDVEADKRSKELEKWKESVRSFTFEFHRFGAIVAPVVISRFREIENVQKGLNRDGTLPATEGLRDLRGQVHDVTTEFDLMPVPIDHATAALDRASKATRRLWSDELRPLAEAFARLAQISGPLGGTAAMLGNLIAALDLASTATANLTTNWETATADMSKGGKIAFATTQILAMVAALDQATKSGSTLSRTLSGAATGAAIGSMFGPIGTAIGAIGGAAVGFFRGIFGGGKAKDEERRAREIERINKEVAKLTAAAPTVQTLLQDIVDYGGQIPVAMSPFIAQMQALGLLTGDVTQDFERMRETAEAFGVDLEALGPAFKQAEIDRTAKKILNAFTLLDQGGANTGMILQGMSDEISEMVQKSMAFGTTIPENFRPLIEQLIETGQLLDDNGVAIDDINRIKFGDPIAEGLQGIIDRLDELLIGLGIKLPEVIAGLPGRISIPIDFPMNLPDVPSFASGTHGRYLDFGRGTPVMLHGRERVMTAGEGGSSGPQVIQLVVDGRILSEVVTSHQDANLRTRKRLRAA
jgi:hypothetical protein